MHYKYSVVILLATGLIGCIDDDIGISTKIIALDLNGTWISNCYLDEVGVYKIDKYVFLDNLFETSHKKWRSDTCSGSLFESATGEGLFTVGETFTTK